MTEKHDPLVKAVLRAGLPPEGYVGEGKEPHPVGKVRNLRHTLTLDEAIAHALDVARNYPAEIGDDESLACVCQHHQLARWLTELRERRKLGYHPPCPSCRWRHRCVTTDRGAVSKDWHCTMYEHSEEAFPAIPGTPTILCHVCRNVPDDCYLDGASECSSYEPIEPTTETRTCLVCDMPQFRTPGGWTCVNGHGGAPAKGEDEVGP